MNRFANVPEHFRTVIRMLEERAEKDLMAFSLGMLAIFPDDQHTHPSEMQLGISHGLGHYDVRTVAVSKKLMGDQCCTINFLDASLPGEEKSVGAKAYFFAPSRPEEMASNIWAFFKTGEVPADCARPPYEPTLVAVTSASLAAITHDMKLSIQSGELKVPGINKPS